MLYSFSKCFLHISTISNSYKISIPIYYSSYFSSKPFRLLSKATPISLYIPIYLTSKLFIYLCNFYSSFFNQYDFQTHFFRNLIILSILYHTRYTSFKRLTASITSSFHTSVLTFLTSTSLEYPHRFIILSSGKVTLVVSRFVQYSLAFIAIVFANFSLQLFLYHILLSILSTFFLFTFLFIHYSTNLILHKTK